MTQVYLILLNGPPYSGKDTGADALHEYFENSGYVVMRDRFSMPLKQSVCAWLGVRCYDSGHSSLERYKDEVIQSLGVSYRQAQIDLSEKHMKVLYGKHVFGNLLRDRLHQRVRDLVSSTERDDHKVVYIVPDSGFDYEAKPVVDSLNHGHTLLFRVHREGKTFDGDSRSYIELDNAYAIDVYNDTTQAHYEQMVQQVASSWMRSFDK